MTARKAYPSDVNDDEWAFVAPCLTLLPEDVSQRTYRLRDAFNALQYIVHTGMQWRMMPSLLPMQGIILGHMSSGQID